MTNDQRLSTTMHQHTEKTSPPYAWAAVTAVIVFAIYYATLGPTIAFWDTAEYTAAAKVLGIPHPPGNPLFVILGHSFGLLPLVASYAARINLFAAVTSALAAGFWFLVADRWLRTIVPFRPARLAAAFAGVLVGATMWTVWNQSTVNEKVYTVSVLSVALALWIAVHWGDDEPGPHRDRWLILIAYVITLSSTNHMMGVLAAPAVLVYVLWTDWREAFRPWVLMLGWLTLVAVTGEWTGVVQGTATGIFVALVTLGLLGWALARDRRNPMLYLGIAAVVVGISLNYVFLPIRAAQYPPINEGEPTTWQALLDVLNRVQYQKPPVTDRQADFLSQLGMYWIYWKWQFARDWERWRPVATAFFTTLGLVGLWTLLRRDRRAGVAALTLLGSFTFALIFYLNFKYGFSQHPDRPELPREVRERDYFFICSFAYFGTLVAVGFGALLQSLASLVRGRVEWARWAAGAPLLLLAFVPLLGNRLTASRAGETTPHDFALDLLHSVEPYGILITAGDNDTFPLWFAQEVLGVRRDVLLANLSLLATEWHLKQIRRREAEPFDPAKALPLWQAPDSARSVPLGGPPPDSVPRRWTMPTEPPLALSEAELVALPEIMVMPAERGLRVRGIEMVLSGEYLDRSTLAVIFLIRDNLGERPIYFSWSDAGMPDETLGLTPYLVTEGLVRRLNSAPVQPGGSIRFSRGMGFVDLDRSRVLLEQYRWRSAARPRPRGWVDQSSGSILSLYWVIYGGLADVYREVGDTATAARADSISNAVRRALAPPTAVALPRAPGGN
ncbi:MAG TPA: DUF2723 domain-containing protein [Gemmatimonadales bacterium]